LSADRFHNLTLCEGDLKAASSSITTLEKVVEEWKKKEAGKLLFPLSFLRSAYNLTIQMGLVCCQETALFFTPTYY